MNPTAQEDLQERIQRLLDGDMTQQEADALDAELRSCRKSRERYIQLATLHSALENHFASRSANEPGQIISIDRLLSRQRQRMRHLATLAAAAILILAAIPLWLKLTRGPSHLASFQTTPDAIYQLNHAEEQSGNANEPLLRPGSRLKLTSGRLEANFSSGARCILQAPCELTALNGQQVQLHEGAAWFHVPPQAKGFEVRTRHLHVVDLGTEFGVLAHADGEDEIHVIQGSVEAAPILISGKPGPKQPLLAGQARRITETGELIQTALRSSLFPSRLFPQLSIRNAHFDTLENLHEEHDKNGYGMIPSWASSGAGIGLSHRKQPFLQQPPHSGTHVAFIQGKGSISQTITGFDPSKPYTITYFVSERGLPGAATRTSASLDLGSTSFIQPDLIRKTDAFRRIVSGPLRVFGPSANIQISAQTVEGDASLLIDSVAISRAVPTIPDGGFEMALLPVKTLAQAHTADRTLLGSSPWKFTGGGGIIHNGSGFVTPPAPEGSQAAVLQGIGATMETTLHGFEPGVTYRLHLQSSGRENDSAKLKILLDGNPLAFTKEDALHPTDRKYKPFTSEEFKATSDTSILRIETTSQGTAFLDDLHFEFVAEAEE